MSPTSSCTWRSARRSARRSATTLPRRGPAILERARAGIIRHGEGAGPGGPMYGSIRRYKVSKPAEFTERVNDSFINVLRKVPGFISYTAIDEGSGSWASVSLFVSKDGGTRSDVLAAEWVREHAADRVTGAPEITEGVVVVR